MEVESTKVGDVVIIKIIGELNSRKELTAHLLAHLHKGNFKFLINCTHLRSINSVGMSTLLDFKRMTEASGGAMVLYGLSNHVHKFLQSTRLDEVFTVSEDEDIALSMLIQGLPVLNAASTISRYRN